MKALQALQALEVLKLISIQHLGIRSLMYQMNSEFTFRTWLRVAFEIPLSIRTWALFSPVRGRG